MGKRYIEGFIPQGQVEVVRAIYEIAFALFRLRYEVLDLSQAQARILLRAVALHWLFDTFTVKQLMGNGTTSSSTYRLVQRIVALGYLEPIDSGLYRLTPKYFNAVFPVVLAALPPLIMTAAAAIKDAQSPRT